MERRTNKHAFTRRTMLLALTATGLGSPMLADEPKTSLATKQRLLSSFMPPPSKTIRLRTIAAEFPRTVVTAIDADPMGQYVAVAGDDHAIRILDAETMRVAKTLTGHRDLIRTLAFDSAGEKLVSAGNDGQLIVWDRQANFSVLQRMQGTPALACVRFAPEGNEMAAAGFHNEVYVIGKSGGGKSVLECDCRDLRALAYRDDNEMLAVAGRSGDLHLFNMQTQKLLFEGKIHSGRVHDLKFHRDANTLVSVAEDGTLVVFDTRSQRVLSKTQVTTGKLFTVAIMNSSHVAVAGSDNLIRIVDTDRGRVVRNLEGHVGSIANLSYHGGMLFSGGFDATLRRWSIDGVIENRERIAGGDHGLER